jgi:hypothetical protein
MDAELSRSAITDAPVSTMKSTARPSTRASTWKWPPRSLCSVTVRPEAEA